MSGCHETVPQGTKGKILDREGFQPEIYPPSRVYTGLHGKLILVETVTHTVNETVTVRMKDDMNLIAQVRFQLRMGEKPESLNAVFNDIKPANGGNIIYLQQVYNVYGKMLVNKITREVLSQYNIGDVNDKLQEAKRIRDYNKMIANGITPELLELRRLEVQQALVNAIGTGDATTVFVPYSALGTTGLNNRVMLSGKSPIPSK